MKQFIYVGLLFIIMLGSCSIEKKHYSSGYNIDMNKGKKYVKQNDETLVYSNENQEEKK